MGFEQQRGVTPVSGISGCAVNRSWHLESKDKWGLIRDCFSAAMHCLQLFIKAMSTLSERMLLRIIYNPKTTAVTVTHY